MRNLTLTASEDLIEEARLVARAQHTTLNAAFREWLQTYTRQNGRAAEYDSLMASLKDVRSSGPYTRDEMNGRESNQKR